MIEVGLEFRASSRKKVFETLFSLPESIRPTHRCKDEEDVGIEIGDYSKFSKEVENRETGIMLKSPLGTFDISLAGGEAIRCSFFLDAAPEVIMAFLIHMAHAEPIFGFASMPEERERRNRVKTVQGMNTMESWVGRDTANYIPGLYWITLLSDRLMQHHNVAVKDLAGVAREYIEPTKGQHILRFYDEPGNWKLSDHVIDLIDSQPGIFHLERAQAEMTSAKTFLELSAATRKWK